MALCVSLTATAGPIGLQQAKAIAKKCAKSANGPLHAPQSAEMQLVQIRTATAPVGKTTDYPLYYVFDRPGGDGYIIVAGDDRMRGVIAESDHGNFDTATSNPGLRWWLDAVAETAERIARSDDDAPRYTQSAVSSQVEPLIQTQWGQNAPYNLLCPTVDGWQCVTGCVATAMSQVFYYLQYPSKATGEVSYSYNLILNGKKHEMNLSANLSDYSFDYSKMLLSYSSDDTSEAAQEVAKLMYACGIASEMYYSPVSSGSNVKYSVLTENFGLDKSCRMAQRENYTTDEWEAILRGELDEARPVFYSGSDTDGNGHQFICDGYDAAGKFHINWGWTGYDDGYFDLSAITYSENQQIIYNLKPDEGGTADGFANLSVGGIALYDSTTPCEATLGNYLNIQVNKFDAPFVDFNGYAGIGIYQGDEPLAASFYRDQAFSIPAGYYSTFYYSMLLPANLSDGVYTLRPVAGPSKTDYDIVRQASDIKGSPYLLLNVVNGKAIITDCMKTIPEAGYASFSAFAPVTIPDDVTAYTARMNDDNSKVLLSAIDGSIIPANTGVILYHKGGGTFLLDLTSESSSESFLSNELIASTVQPTVPSEGSYYALKAGEDKFASLKNGIELSVGKAYIKANTSNGVKSLPIELSDTEYTAIEGIQQSETTAKSGNQDFYTLQGIRVSHPSHGIYIHNGKKIYIK